MLIQFLPHREDTSFALQNLSVSAFFKKQSTRTLRHKNALFLNMLVNWYIYIYIYIYMYRLALHNQSSIKTDGNSVYG